MTYRETNYRTKTFNICPRCLTEAKWADKVVETDGETTYYYTCPKCGYKWFWNSRRAWEQGA